MGAEKQKKPKKYHPRPDRRGPVSIRDQDLGKEFPRPPEETEKQKNRKNQKNITLDPTDAGLCPSEIKISERSSQDPRKKQKSRKTEKTKKISPSTRPTRARLHPRSRSWKGVPKTPGRNRKAEKQKKPKKYHPRPDRRGPA